MKRRLLCGAAAVATVSGTLACGGGTTPEAAASPRSSASVPSSAMPATAGSSPSAPPAPSSSAAARPESEMKHQLSLNLDARFVLRERNGTSVIIAEQGKKRLLEVHKLEGAGCSAELVPRIGAETSLTLTDKTRHGELDFLWFTQKSTVEQMPFAGLGFYMCSHHSFVVVRYVGPVESLGDARASLERLLADRAIVID